MKVKNTVSGGGPVHSAYSFVFSVETHEGTLQPSASERDAAAFTESGNLHVIYTLRRYHGITCTVGIVSQKIPVI